MEITTEENDGTVVPDPTIPMFRPNTVVLMNVTFFTSLKELHFVWHHHYRILGDFLFAWKFRRVYWFAIPSNPASSFTKYVFNSIPKRHRQLLGHCHGYTLLPQGSCSMCIYLYEIYLIRIALNCVYIFHAMVLIRSMTALRKSFLSFEASDITWDVLQFLYNYIAIDYY